ncbi:MAG: hypothetical protein AVDCRST_MAG30-3048, partial [uncultured Solirubrobacteraceae bacterium]
AVLGRAAREHPGAVRAPLEVAARDELAQRGGDGRAAGADHAGEGPVRQPQADPHALGGDAAPALGEVPEQREQPVVDAGEMGDGLQDHETVGPAGGAVDEAGDDLGPRRGGRDEPRAEQRDARRRQDGPVDGAAEQLVGVGVLDRADEVARAEELGAGVVTHRRLADEQAAQDEEAEDPVAALLVDVLR